MGNGILREYHFSVDDFNQPKKTEGKSAIGVFLIRLILMDPGTNQNRPEMGLGIVSKYRYMQESDMDALSAELKNQINTYLAPYSTVNVSITMDTDLQLIFDISVDDYTYKYVTVQQKNNNEITLSELLN